MIRRNVGWLAACLSALFACAGSVHATDIGGAISTTLTITEDSRLVDDVTCTVTGAACIAVGAAGVTLDLNGFTMTGRADPATSCFGGAIAGAGGEFGILLNGFSNVTIRGPGLVQRFRAQGIQLNNSSGSTIRDVTSSTNCASGFQLNNGSNNLLENNVSVRNGHVTSACGGI
ncbi:MAG: right-handed parallel beta-helix repeat-containing protein [Bryobacterales bacterium]|nr:right-handed parallel beta-helix repeat-containing protein [Bryobacterales bacterium]